MKKITLFVLAALAVNILNAQTTIWSENFNTQANFNAWTLIDGDGDTYNWTYSANTGVGATGCAYSASWIGGVGAVTPNNYITSPPIDLSSTTGAIALDWSTYAQDQAWPKEKYKVMISTSNTKADIDAGTKVFEEILTANGAYVTRTVDLSQWAGELIFITFIHFDCTDWFRVNMDDIKVYQPVANDAGITDIKSPSNANGCNFSAAESPIVTIFNYGGSAITNFEVSYTVNGGAPVTETVTATIPSATSYDYTFATPFDASALGEYVITATTNLAGDASASNNEAVENFRHSDASISLHIMTDVSGGHNWSITDKTTNEVIASYTAGYAWNSEFFEDICVYSDRCYSLTWNGQMGAGAFLEVLYNGVTVAGNTSGAGVDATFEVPSIGGACAPNDGGVIRLNTGKYHEVNDNVVISGVIKNLGSDPIGTLRMEYDVNGANTVSETFVGLNVAPGATYNYEFATPFTVAAATEYNLQVRIMEVNGIADDITGNNNSAQQMSGMTYTPDRGVVAEEATGTWCPWCPRGAIMLEKLTTDYPEAIGIAVHNGDPMTITEYDSPFSALINGYPSIVLDRTILDALPNTLAEYPALEALFTNQLNAKSPVQINATATLGANNSLSIDLSTEFLAPLSGDYRYNVIVVEDGVTGTTSLYSQANAYAGGGNGPMGGYEALPSPVPAAQMVYDHVGRALLGGFNGTANSLPTSISRGYTNTYNYTYTVPTTININNMTIVAMIINNADGSILNAKHVTSILSGTNNPTFANDLAKVYPNPSSSWVNVELSLSDLTETSMTIVNSLGQLVAEKHYGELNGKTVLPIDATDFSNGVYFARISVGDKLVVKSFTISK